MFYNIRKGHFVYFYDFFLRNTFEVRRKTISLPSFMLNIRQKGTPKCPAGTGFDIIKVNNKKNVEWEITTRQFCFL